jgi:hypothetical protein
MGVVKSCQMAQNGDSSRAAGQVDPRYGCEQSPLREVVSEGRIFGKPDIP